MFVSTCSGMTACRRGRGLFACRRTACMPALRGCASGNALVRRVAAVFVFAVGGRDMHRTMLLLAAGREDGGEKGDSPANGKRPHAEAAADGADASPGEGGSCKAARDGLAGRAEDREAGGGKPRRGRGPEAPRLPEMREWAGPAAAAAMIDEIVTWAGAPHSMHAPQGMTLLATNRQRMPVDCAVHIAHGVMPCDSPCGHGLSCFCMSHAFDMHIMHSVKYLLLSFDVYIPALLTAKPAFPRSNRNAPLRMLLILHTWLHRCIIRSHEEREKAPATERHTHDRVCLHQLRAPATIVCVCVEAVACVRASGMQRPLSFSLASPASARARCVLRWQTRCRRSTTICSTSRATH